VAAPELRERVDHALSSKGALLVEADRDGEALATYDALIARLEGDTESELAVRWADAMLGKGFVLFKESRAEAADVFESVVERARHSDDAELRKRAVPALTNKFMTFGHLGREDEALAAHRELAERFGAEALAAYDEQIKRFADAVEPTQRHALRAALTNKASLLMELGRRKEAIALQEQLLAWFEGDEDPYAAELVAMVRGVREQLLKDTRDHR
jgi:hypothetical protein